MDAWWTRNNNSQYNIGANQFESHFLAAASLLLSGF